MFEEYQPMQEESQSAEINMGPLIDMVFILLIFFIITTNFNRQTGVDVAKPKARTAAVTGRKTLLIGISREGTVHVYGRQMSLDRLRHLVGGELTRRPDMSIVIVADRHADIGRAVEVMDQCALAGAERVSIAADKE